LASINDALKIAAQVRPSRHRRVIEAARADAARMIAVGPEPPS
jgi:hypothetical protein